MDLETRKKTLWKREHQRHSHQRRKRKSGEGAIIPQGISFEATERHRAFITSLLGNALVILLLIYTVHKDSEPYDIYKISIMVILLLGLGTLVLYIKKILRR